MPNREDVVIDVREVTLHDPTGGQASIGSLPGVQVVVLLRHRH